MQTAIKERPILFSGPMVRAILSGTKTQTRRIIKPQPTSHFSFMPLSTELVGVTKHGGEIDKRGWVICPYGQPGDRLWVREHHARTESPCNRVHYFADGPMTSISERHDAGLLRSHPSIHMPRWASRITLEVKKIRVERLQDISYDDCISEGTFQASGYEDEHGIRSEGRRLFEKLWDEINPKIPFLANPWVWVIEFERVK